MKNKKLFSLFAVGLALSLFSGCAPANKVNFRNYWDSNSLSNVAEDIRETLEYDVTFVKATPTVDYEISYSNGKYKTELTYANGQYTYTTSLSIEVTYTLNGETTATLQDSVLTNVVFTTAENGLYPVSSSKTIVSHSPVGSKQTQADKCYKLHDYQVTTNYTNEGNTCKVVKNATGANPETSEKRFKTSGEHRYLDNEQILFAFRGCSNSVTSGKFLVYSPFVKRLQTVNFALSDKAKATFTFTKNGVSKEREIFYRTMQMQLNEKNPGLIQTAKYASVTDPTSNEYRNVMLSLETPLSYNLGKLVYTLNSATYQ